jgi:hypothetical protein
MWRHLLEDTEATFLRFYLENHTDISIPSRRTPPSRPRSLSFFLCWNFILEQSMGARNRVGMGCRTGPPGHMGWRNRFVGFDYQAP